MRYSTTCSWRRFGFLLGGGLGLFRRLFLLGGCFCGGGRRFRSGSRCCFRGGSLFFLGSLLLLWLGRFFFLGGGCLLGDGLLYRGFLGRGGFLDGRLFRSRRLLCCRGFLDRLLFGDGSFSGFLLFWCGFLFGFLGRGCTGGFLLFGFRRKFVRVLLSRTKVS